MYRVLGNVCSICLTMVLLISSSSHNRLVFGVIVEEVRGFCFFFRTDVELILVAPHNAEGNVSAAARNTETRV